MNRGTDFQIAGESVPAGSESRVEIPVARLPSGTWESLPVIVLHGRRPGPTLWVSAAVHGDEVGGIEVIHRLRPTIDVARLRGTVLAIPVVNVFGFVAESRYLPDRRDLNRSFPGSTRGSLASRLAHLFMTEVVDRSDVGVDLHTGSGGRTNLPQVRADLDDPLTLQLSKAFGTRIILHSRNRDGSLRAAATRRGKTVLLYEGGEASRFTESAIVAGVRGVRRTMAELGMIRRGTRDARTPLIARRTGWVRARRSGLVRHLVRLGATVARGERVASISEPLGETDSALRAPHGGLIVGQSRTPIVHQGDAVVHIARVGE